MEIVHLKKPTNGIYLDLVFRGGSIVESKPGLAHFLEHMTFCGTVKRSEAQIQKELSEEGIQYNACTDHDYVAYQAHFDKDSLKVTTDIMSDILMNSTFPEDLLERERGVILQELARHNSDPQSVVYDLLFKGLYKGSKYAISVLGTEETIKSITRDDIVEYYKKLWTGNACLSVYGDIVPEIKIIEEGEKICRESIDFDESEKYLEKEMDTEANIVTYGWRGYSFLKDKPQEYFDLAILTRIMGRADTGRIYERIRTKMGLSYNPSMAFYAQGDTGVVIGSFTTTPDKCSLCKNALEDEVEKMIQDGPTKEEVEREIKSQTKFEKMGEDKTNWTGKASRRFVRLSKDFFDNYEEKYRAVTVESVHECAKKYLSTNPTVAMVCPKK